MKSIDGTEASTFLKKALAGIATGGVSSIIKAGASSIIWLNNL